MGLEELKKSSDVMRHLSRLTDLSTHLAYLPVTEIKDATNEALKILRVPHHALECLTVMWSF